MDEPGGISGSAFCTVKSSPTTLVLKVLSAPFSAKSPTVSAQGVLCECVRVPTSPKFRVA